MCDIHIFYPEKKGGKEKQKKKPRKNKKHINLLYCNINGIRGKIKSLEEVMTTEETDIAMLTETKGQPPAIEGYTWYSKERKKCKGGGVAIAVKNNMANITSILEINEWEEMEILWIKVHKSGEEEIYLGCYYGLQEKAEKDQVTTQFEHLKTQISMIQHKGSVILAGDFNAKLRNHEPNYNQEISRNGKIMEQFLQETKMENINHMSRTGRWTRVNRHKNDEKSIIDYIIVNQAGKDNILELEIDERGTKRMQNPRSESDHNTITAKMTSHFTENDRKTIKRWKINEDTNWELYNNKLKELIKNSNEGYKYLEEKIRQALEESVGSRTIRVDESKKQREPAEIKNLRREKKEKRKRFSKAPIEIRMEALEEYYEAQRALRKAVEEMERTRIRKTIEEITRSKDKNAIWKVRKKLLGKKRGDYDIIDENGHIITDPEEAKEHIARYFEELYQARDAGEKGREWTTEILRNNKETENKCNKGERLPDISEKEMNIAKKKLKRRKSCGPDNIPNEAIIHANRENTNEIRKQFNKILSENNIPKTWKNGRIITVYKGKGVKGKCSNERGISISSNMGKMFERIINERAKEHINISDMQGGGKKGAQTIDHILALREAIRKGKEVYIAFMDVTKAYDKAWASGIMHVLEKQGINNKLWSTIKELNEDLKAFVETKHGNTRTIKLKDNIRQGGVLSVIMYATLMDEIAKEVRTRNLGVPMREGEKLGCLLWMDDVAFIAEKKEDLQEMLDIAEEVSAKYRIKFGEEKSKIIKIGKKLPEVEFKIGGMTLGYCERYKYLGIFFSCKNNMEEHIKETKRKTEAAFNTAMAIAGSTNLKNIELKVIWELVDVCIIPIITYGWEAITPRKADEKQLKQIVENLIKRVLIMPTSTPWEPLYLETGIQEIGLKTTRNRLNYMEKVKKSNNTVMKMIQEDLSPKSWWSINTAIKRDILRTNETNQPTTNSQNTSTETEKKVIKRKLNEKLMDMIKEGHSKTKTKFYLDNKLNPTPGQRARYMNECNRMEASTIFRARTRMLKVKCNYKKMFPNTNCRLCRKEEESQEHILETCSEIDRIRTGKITKKDIFEEDPEKLKETAKIITKIMENVECSPPPTGRSDPDEPGRHMN